MVKVIRFIKFCAACSALAAGWLIGSFAYLAVLA